ncbi:MAG: spore cortex biosynthesis protein YabQ [Oscillospiraceae bacterium]|jgi:hypothetical protein|nr:spore cortex biosynthesis protein YabQ [Oscillospiraceae bacterium]
MEIKLTTQAMEAAYAFLMGIASGVLYDVLSVFRRMTKGTLRKTVIAGVLDAAYCTVCALGFFMLGFGPGGGRLRFTLLLFVAPGIALYMLIFSKLVTKGLYSLLKIIRRIIQWCLRPFRLLNRARKQTGDAIRKRVRYVNKVRRIDGTYKLHTRHPAGGRGITGAGERSPLP